MSSMRFRKELVGIVIRHKMQKTAVVEVTRLVRHRVYGKVIRMRKRYLVHDEKDAAREGNRVRISESRPISKMKRWRLVEVLAK